MIGIVGTSLYKNRLKEKLKSKPAWAVETLPKADKEYLLNNARGKELLIIPKDQANQDHIKINKLFKQKPDLRNTPTILYGPKINNINAIANGFDGFISDDISSQKIHNKIEKFIKLDKESRIIATNFTENKKSSLLSAISQSNFTIFGYDHYNKLKEDINAGLKISALIIELNEQLNHEIDKVTDISSQYNIPIVSIVDHSLRPGQIEKIQSASIGVFESYPNIENELILFLNYYLGQYKKENQRLMEKWLNNFLNVTEEAPEFEELFYSYLERIISQINRLEAYILMKDREKIHKISHKLKGNTGNYQLHEIAHNAENICELSRTEEDFDLQNISQNFIELKALYCGTKRLG